MHHSLSPLQLSLRPIHSWAARSQQAACRNAMVATTELSVRRHERLEVEEFLAGARARRTALRGNAARLA